MKNIMITGINSYIGGSVKQYLAQFANKYSVSETDTLGLKPVSAMFSGVDTVFCVAGIAHIKETVENKHLFFDVNRDLVFEIAKAAKEARVKQFILLSSMSVYGLTIGHIKKNTMPNPNTAYGESKLQADEKIKKLEDNGFIFTCLRPPMVYGKNCPGNYQSLRRIALNSPLFPDFNNQRSMIYIGNLCEFVKDCIDSERGGLFFPQNSQYVNTSQIVKMIAQEHERRIILTQLFNWAIKSVPINMVKKAFGNLTYELVDTVGKYSFTESIRLTEK